MGNISMLEKFLSKCVRTHFYKDTVKQAAQYFRRVREMQNGAKTIKNRRGFTLAELLIVVAIIAVLVAISIPIFNSQLEKSRRAVDMDTARNIESILASAINDGTIQIPASTRSDGGRGIWVVIGRDSKSKPTSYPDLTGTVFCGADEGTVIDGVTMSGNWDVNRTEIKNLLLNSGMSQNSLKVTCKKSSSTEGWDWINVYVGYTEGEFITRIYSGQTNDWGNAWFKPGQTNIEKAIG